MLPVLFAAGAPSDYRIERSLRLRAAASAYLSRTPAVAGSRTTWTWGGWIKRGMLDSGFGLFERFADASTFAFCRIAASGVIQFYNIDGGIDYGYATANILRDPSAWYQLVFAFDTTNAVEADRMRAYVNGQRVTIGVDWGSPPLGFEGLINANSAHTIGRHQDSANYADGYIADVHFIDGQALTPAAFGETDTVTGVWKAKKYTGTYGTNGFYLDFKDNSAATATAIGTDTSGNGNDWTPVNVSVTAGVTYDSMLDAPNNYADGGNGRGNYCTLNPLSAVGGTVSNGGLRYIAPVATRRINGTIGVSSGKWYFEAKLANAPYSPRSTGTHYNSVGVGLATVFSSSNDISTTTDVLSVMDSGYYKNFNGAQTDIGSAFAVDDTISIALDLDANTFVLKKNDVTFASGVIGVAAGTLLVPMVGSYSGDYGVMDLNFGQRPFTYTPPAGYKALNTQNLPDPDIKRPKDYFNAKTFAANASVQAITGVGHSPDLVWLKSRGNGYSHALHDSVRGVTKYLSTNNTNAEGSAPGGISSFDDDGYTLGPDDNANFSSGSASIGWSWKKGAIPGFDIVTFTGTGAAQAIPHNLGVAPAMIITKNRGGADIWRVYHKKMNVAPHTGYLVLNGTDAFIGSTFWNSAAPTSSQFAINAFGAGVPGLAYLFAEVAGFSKFDSYVGNGSADGPFVYCGFRPRFVMFKRVDNIGDWLIFDAARAPHNTADNMLNANSANAESYDSGGSPTTGYPFDILSSGFKQRSAGSYRNAAGGIYIFMAFAEHPFKYARAR